MIDEETHEIEEPCEPDDYAYDMKRLEPIEHLETP
jgi:hypothetical protein